MGARKTDRERVQTARVSNRCRAFVRQTDCHREREPEHASGHPDRFEASQLIPS